MKLLPVVTLFLSALGMLAPVCASAQGNPAGKSARAGVELRITVPAIVRVKALAQPERIALEEKHITQGYIDLDDASSLLLTSNSARGYHLAVAFDAGILDRVLVRIADQQLDASDGSGSVDVRAERLVDAPVHASYRLYLKPGVRSGSYRWPVALAFSTRATA
jgi:hypothetical protein